MGAGDLVLDGMTREEALTLLAEGAAPQRPAGRGAERQAPISERPGRRHASVTERPVPVTEGAGPATERGGSRAGAPDGRQEAGPESSSGAVKRASLPVLPDDYTELRNIALACTACRLSDGRTQVVFSDGPQDARLMVVGEAPGANEDQTGTPFVGAAGQYLDLLLSTVGLGREDSVYIANVLKCRPPGNRDPMADEIETCSPFLKKQIDLVQPEVLLAVGSFSGKLLTGQDKTSLGRLRGQVHRYHGVPLVVTYHPAALLRNANWTRSFWDDLQLLRDVMDDSRSG
jgi:uracil-DNA glycosylase